MQWLNKLDESLDRVFLRPPKVTSAASGSDDGAHGSCDGDDVGASSPVSGLAASTVDVTGSANPSQEFQGNSKQNQEQTIESETLLMESQMKTIEPEKIATGRALKIENVDSKSHANIIVDATHSKLTTQKVPPIPPPPPPPPITQPPSSQNLPSQQNTPKIAMPVQSQASATPRPSKILAHEPLTPIEKAAAIMSSSGEFLADFLDESPGCSIMTANNNGNDQSNTNKNTSECMDGRNCQPLDSILYQRPDSTYGDSFLAEERTLLVPETQQQQQQDGVRENDQSDWIGNKRNNLDSNQEKKQRTIPPPPFLASQSNQQFAYGQQLHQQAQQLTQEPSSAFIVHLPVHPTPPSAGTANKSAHNNPNPRPQPPPIPLPPPLPPAAVNQHEPMQHSSPQKPLHPPPPPPPPPVTKNDANSQLSTPIMQHISHTTKPNTRAHESDNAKHSSSSPPRQHTNHRSLSNTSTLSLTPRSIPAPRLTLGVTTPRATPGVIRSRIRAPSVSPPESDSDNEEEVGSSVGSSDNAHLQSLVAAAPPISDIILNEYADQDDGAKSLEPSPLLSPIESKSHVFIPPLTVGSDNDTKNKEGLTQNENILVASPAARTIQRDILGGQRILPAEKSDVILDDHDNGEDYEFVDKQINNAEVAEDDDNSSSASFHSHRSKESELTDDEGNRKDNDGDREDFLLPSPHSSIVSFSDDRSWDPTFNRYGIVHVRLLRAQRLPCAPGATVNASLSLPPWKGRIRIPGSVAVDGPEGAGMCVRWDKPLDDKRDGDSKQIDLAGNEDGASPRSPELLEEPMSHSMVHPYNDVETPIPTISLEISTPTFGGVLEKYMCSTSLPCHVLLRSPGMWIRRWLPATLAHETPISATSSAASNKGLRDQLSEDNLHTSLAEDRGEIENEFRPWVLLEACFEPKVEDSELMISEDDTLGSIPRDFVMKSRSPDGRIRDAKSIPENLYSSTDDESISKTSTLTTMFTSRNTSVSKSHLLRVRNFWTPAWCAVCSKVLVTGWMRSNFECEACHIFCCKDCQLQVDVRVPCGSELAKAAVKNAEMYHVSFSRIMTTLAPHDANGSSVRKSGNDIVEDKTKPQSETADVDTHQHETPKVTDIKGIGLMNIRVLKACLFDKHFPPEAEPGEVFGADSSNLRIGDHYCRISWLGSKDSRRTKTVLQASKPVFDSDDMTFDVPHYGMQYKLEVVDANTDKPVGASVLSAQEILQWQRDQRIRQGVSSLLNMNYRPEPRRTKLELRTGVKDAFGLNFYNASKLSGESKEKISSGRAGEISGWIEVDVLLEEDSKLFYSSKPRQCPPRAKEDFDIALIQLHIARISTLVEDIQKMVSTYLYVVSWKNRPLTGASLATFVVVALVFDLEYIGSLPIGFLVIYMIYLGHLRFSGHFNDRWVLKEKEALVESESKIERNHLIERPVGLLSVSNLRGRNIRSRDLGLPGSFSCSITYDPVRYASDKMKKSLAKQDDSCSYSHGIAVTVSPGITSNPTWTHMRESAELMRLKHLLPNDRLWGESERSDDGTTTTCSTNYPIPQPIAEGVSFAEQEEKDDAGHSGIQLLPWESSFGAVVLQVRFSDVLGSFQVFDAVIGEVVIPLSKLASGSEVEGWFRLLPVGTTETVPGHSSDDDDALFSSFRSSSPVFDDGNEEKDGDATHHVDFPELYVKIKFLPNVITNEMDSERESSKVICEEMVRTASMFKESNISMIGSSISTLNTVRSLGGNLQNQLSDVVDTVERVRNAFNFSNPQITSCILVCLFVLWRILAMVPTRIVVLIAGVGQFGATFYAEFIEKPTPTVRKEKLDEDEDESPRGNAFENLFLSIPTDEDLRRTYFWEAHRMGEREREKFAITKRKSRLDNLWKARWHGPLKIKEKKTGLEPSNKRNWTWEPVFALVEGHRFIWWRSEKHFDTGEAPLGQIFFAGHSGLAGLSPLDLREFVKEEIPFVVSVFGRGLKEQQKISLLASSSGAKESLEDAVLYASMDVKSD